jgi:FtsW/RodA/SpoVE-like cell cycle protein
MTFFVHAMVDGGMVSGLLPVIGVPMPTLSCGGTSVVSLARGLRPCDGGIRASKDEGSMSLANMELPSSFPARPAC